MKNKLSTPTAVHTTSSIAHRDDKGRRIGQRLHDAAPGASLVFYASDGGQADMAQKIHNLAAGGADVIVDDILYLDESILQDGAIDQSVNQVVAKGVPYFLSSGNDARQSYESEYRAQNIVGE